MQLVWCEKEDQARRIAEFLTMTAINKKPQHYYKDNVAVAYPPSGHLVVLRPPEFYKPEMKGFDLSHLPILPDRFEFVVDHEKRIAFKKIEKLFSRASEVIIATDPDPDGEAIGRNVLKQTGFKGPVKRALYAAMDDESLTEAFRNLQSLKLTDSLYREWLARACTDWLYGMNLTRAMSCLVDEFTGEKNPAFNVGRVLIVAVELVALREQEIEQFEAIRHYTVEVDVQIGEEVLSLKWSPPKQLTDEGYLTNKKIADKVVEHLLKKDCLQIRYKKSVIESDPPLPLDSDELVKQASRRSKLEPVEAMNGAQRLYHPKSFTYYPRTERRFIPKRQHKNAPQILEQLLAINELSEYKELLDPKVISKAFDDSKIKLAKQAIVPTPEFSADKFQYLNEIEKSVFLIIARYYMAQFAPVSLKEKLEIEGIFNDLVFKGVNSRILDQGWRTIIDKEKKTESSSVAISDFLSGEEGEMHLKLVDVRVNSHLTEPKSRFTKQGLVNQMKKIDEIFKGSSSNEALLAATKGKGIGTPGTRPSMVEKAIKKSFLKVRADKRLETTDKYRRFRNYIPALIRDLEQSLVWTYAFKQVEAEQISIQDFIDFQKKIVSRLVDEVKGNVSKYRQEQSR